MHIYIYSLFVWFQKHPRLFVWDFWTNSITNWRIRRLRHLWEPSKCVNHSQPNSIRKKFSCLFLNHSPFFGLETCLQKGLEKSGGKQLNEPWKTMQWETIGIQLPHQEGEIRPKKKETKSYTVDVSFKKWHVGTLDTQKKKHSAKRCKHLFLIICEAWCILSSQVSFRCCVCNTVDGRNPAPVDR